VLHAKTIPTDRDEARFLISVRKAIGNAPKRNRIKRLVREAMRRHRHEISEPHDICFFLTAKPGEPISLATIEKEVQTLFNRLSRKD
jgi:ribonuclease P protein component